MTAVRHLLAPGPTSAAAAIVAAFACGAIARGETPLIRQQFDRAVSEVEEAQNIREHRPDQARQLLLSAAQRFESIAAAGVDNGRLEYDIGTCYLQAGDLGRAILHYRRAEQLIPRDPYLADNLRAARSRRVVQIEPGRGGTVLRALFFWHFQTSAAARTRTALAVWVGFWALLTIHLCSPRRWLAVTAGLAGGLALALAGSIGVSHWSTRNQPAGVVLAMDVPVQTGPGEQSDRRFAQPLQPGVEFVVLERRGRWWRIELPDGQTGWIDRSAAELVPRSRADDA